MIKLQMKKSQADWWINPDHLVGMCVDNDDPDDPQTVISVSVHDEPVYVVEDPSEVVAKIVQFKRMCHG